MRTALLLIALTAGLLAGCSSPPSGEDTSATSDALPTNDGAPAPVAINESVDLTLGGKDSWTFTVADTATSADIRFALKPLAGGPAAAGQPVCFRFQTPDGQGSHGQCVGGQGNIAIAPNVVLQERLYFELHEVHPGRYSFSVDGQPGPMELHAYAKVVQ